MTTWKHGVLIGILLLAAGIVSLSPQWFGGVPLIYNLSSDATVHEVDWQEYSENYDGAFAGDVMFQNYQAQTTGVLVVDRMLVKLGEAFHLLLPWWNVALSFISVLLFVSGVYALVFKVAKRMSVAFVIAAVSIVPTISLGLSSWGFMAQGFVPKETALAIAVWLTLLLCDGIVKNSRRTIGLFFILLGLCANWYFVLFFHYAAVVLVAFVLWRRSIRLEFIVYGVLFVVCAPVALYDIFIRAAHFTPPDLVIIADHYTAVLHSWKYLFLHYLRKQIIYIALVGGLSYFVHRKGLSYPPLIAFWFAMWWASLAWSLVGVGVELWFPIFEKYLISRISVWFYFISMLLVGYQTWMLVPHWKHRMLQTAAVTGALTLVFLAQTSVINTATGVVELRRDAESYKDYIVVLSQLKAVVPAGQLVLANPDGEANSVRVYGGVGTFVAAKDGNVTLFDGATARQWFERYKATQEIFAQKDFVMLQKFARAQKLQYYVYSLRDIQKGSDALHKETVISAGDYGIAKMY